VSIENLISRLATRGLLPCEHNLTIWQHADCSGWGVAIDSAHAAFKVQAHGETIEEALKALMIQLNRGADLKKS
jgi:hypothetical protein